jgi:hypothetical protein
MLQKENLGFILRLKMANLRWSEGQPSNIAPFLHLLLLLLQLLLLF